MPTKNFKCQHGIWQFWCKPCGGLGICEHGRNRYKCRDCKDAGKTSYLCEHYKDKYHCIQCGTHTCQHGNNKQHCRECGTGIHKRKCPHGKRTDKKTARGEPFCRQCREEASQPTVAGGEQ